MPAGCEAADISAAGPFIVVNIAANDPDGGLVVREAPGPDAASVGLLPSDFGVYVTGACAVVDGGVWWEISEEGVPYWVSSNFIGTYDGIGDRVAVGTTEALCENYDHVADAQQTDIPVTAQLIAMDVELGAHPVGVSAAIRELVNGTSSTDAAWSSIEGYVGPICAGD